MENNYVPTIGPCGAVLPARPAVASALHSKTYFSCLFSASSLLHKNAKGAKAAAPKRREMTKEIEKKETTKEAHRLTRFPVVFRFLAV